MIPSTHTNNYTLGRGEVWFSRYLTGTTTVEGFRYIGNTPELNLTIESETLDHYSSDAGIREKDDSVPLEVNRSGSLTTDNINPENVALFFFGSNATVTTGAATAQADSLTSIKLDHAYMIGATASNPAGVFGLDSGGTNTVAISGGATLVAGTDYEIDYDAGMITFLSGGTVAEGDDIDITYDLAANSRERVISGSEPVEGSMIYRTANPKGDDCTFYFPYVKISPNGDYALKGDEWQSIPMSLEILKPTGQEAIYRDGDPVYS